LAYKVMVDVGYGEYSKHNKLCSVVSTMIDIRNTINGVRSVRDPDVLDFCTASRQVPHNYRAN